MADSTAVSHVFTFTIALLFGNFLFLKSRKGGMCHLFRGMTPIQAIPPFYCGLLNDMNSGGLPPRVPISEASKLQVDIKLKRLKVVLRYAILPIRFIICIDVSKAPPQYRRNKMSSERRRTRHYLITIF